MNLTSKNEKEILKEWAININKSIFEDKVFSRKNELVDSYFSVFDNNSDIEEYCFDTIPELGKLLDAHIDELILRDIKVPITVAIMKSKSIFDSNHENSQEEKMGDMFSIPEFVYVF